MQPRFVEKFPTDLKLGIICTWIEDYLNSNLETDSEKKSKQPKYSPDLFRNLQFTLSLV